MHTYDTFENAVLIAKGFFKQTQRPKHKTTKMYSVLVWTWLTRPYYGHGCRLIHDGLVLQKPMSKAFAERRFQIVVHM